MTKKRVYFVLFILILSFIWGNSLLSADVSGGISHFVADILGGDQGVTDEEHYLLRKLAHFSEFAALGAIAGLLFDLVTEDRVKRSLSIAFIGVFVPLADETIQIFSGRGPALTDVWIDIAGYTCGCIISVSMLFAFRKMRKNG